MQRLIITMLNSKKQGIKDQNYLTQQNNCALISCSSQHARGAATNIISPNARQLWLTNEKLPQQCIFSLKKAYKKPFIFNLIGFYCWHEYDSNPALIQVFVRAEEANKWRLVAKIRLARVSTWQYFKIEEVQAISVGQLKIKIVQNFGGDNTYINKIGLFYHNSKLPLPSQQPFPNSQLASPQQTEVQQIEPALAIQREKTYSQHQSWTGLSQPNFQKELKKANDQIIYLVEQQQQMKKTILQQQKIIIKIQQTLKSVLINMERMQKIQEGYTKFDHNMKKQFYEWNQETEQKHNRVHAGLRQTEKQKRRRAHPNGSHYYQLDNQEEEVPKNKNKREKNNNRENRGSNRRQIQQLKNELNSFEKQSLRKPTSSGKQKGVSQSQSDHPERTEVIGTNSEQQLSEYSHPEGHYRSQNQYLVGNKYKTSTTQKSGEKQIRKSSNKQNRGDKSEMLERLKKLIELKEKKKLQLKNSNAQSSWGKRKGYGQEEGEFDESEEYDFNGM